MPKKVKSKKNQSSDEIPDMSFYGEGAGVESEMQQMRSEMDCLRAELAEVRLSQRSPSPERSQVNLERLRQMPLLARQAENLLEEHDQVLSRVPAAASSSSGRKKSGRNDKITDQVLSPQAWPHAHLSLHLIRNEREYFDLSMPEFMAGFVNILASLEPNSSEFRSRLRHLETLMIYATSFEWRTVLDLHSAVLIDIERGARRWTDSFADIETVVLNSASTSSRHKTHSGHGKFREQRSFNYFCRKFQEGECELGEEHSADVKGKERTVRHICATCALRDGSARQHKRGDSSCPYVSQ